jgi:hypothetical protein
MLLVHQAGLAASSRHASARQQIGTCASLVALLLVVTSLNCLKPVHMDDTYYHAFAAQIAAHPLDPYGFDLTWGTYSRPARHALAPPVFLYWFAAGIRLLGDNPILWKVWLAGFHAIFVVALYAVFKRFAAPLQLGLTWLTVLSAGFLPGFNMMLDIPALGLCLLALVIFFRAVDCESSARAVLAGLVAGLALETKYTALTMPAVMCVYAFLNRKPRLAVCSTAAAAVVFCAWEAFVVWRYGESNFWFNVRDQNGSPIGKWFHLALPLVTLAGGVAPAVALLALAALKVPTRLLLAAIGLVVAGYLAIVVVPDSYTVFWQNASTGKSRLTLSNVVFGGLGAMLLTATLAVVRKLLWWDRDSTSGRTADRRLDWFLISWLILEIGGYFILSPFPAVRRVVGVLVPLTVLCGRLAKRALPETRAIDTVRWAALGSAVLGFLAFAVDLHEALAERQAAEMVAERLRPGTSRGTAWCLGSWGLQFYAQRLGMSSAAPERSRLRAGDWLIVPEAPLWKEELALRSDRFEVIDRVLVADWVPVRTVSCYYGGRTPVEHHDGPRIALTVYRVLGDGVVSTIRGTGK